MPTAYPGGNVRIGIPSGERPTPVSTPRTQIGNAIQSRIPGRVTRRIGRAVSRRSGRA